MKRYKYCGYRHMKTTQEKRANQNCIYVRAKRRSNNLPSQWDDIYTATSRTWKSTRHTQYRQKKRGCRHEYLLQTDEYHRFIYAFQEYCKRYDIPHNIIPIKERYLYTWYQTTKQVKWYQYTRYHQKWNHKTKTFYSDYSHPIGKRWIYRTVQLDTPIRHSKYRYRITAYRIIWWSDKDIGFHRLLQQYNQ